MADKVLIISYYFPPMGGAGIGRPVNLLKYLPEYGIAAEILTVKNVAYRYYDHQLNDQLKSFKIFRSGSRDPQRLMYLMGMRTVKDKTIAKGASVSSRFFPDSKTGWVKPAVKLGRVLLENRGYKAIITTSPPISTHLIGMKLAEEFKIPWIADFRDYWTSYKFEDIYNDPTQRAKAKKLLDKIKEKADHITTVSQSIGKYLGTENVFYNGFDEERSKLWSYQPKDKFVIGLLGTFDQLCPLEPLFELLELLKNKSPELYSKITIKQVGSLNYPDIDALISKYNLTDKIDRLGYYNREETIKLFDDCSLFYLGLNPEFAEGILTSRLFDIIASGRKIIASAPRNSELEQFINSNVLGLGYEKPADALEYLQAAVNSFSEGNWKVQPRAEESKKFSSLRLAESFAKLINKV